MNKLYRICYSITLVAVLIVLPTKADSWRVVESDIDNQQSLPSKQTMRLIGFLTVTINGQVVGGMAVYDDAATKIFGDYAEIYNPKGDLLAILWFDRFGILRSAIDRGIVQNKHAIEGVLVLVTGGDLV